ncbi:FliA/WhiG family RNA polymerase sigma factor [Opitutales bacterium]|nr:FliA/WhiG family RNA polymerase sigma factor [Opitutales bacterium]
MKAGLQEAAGLYQKAMKDKHSRDAWIEKYLPLVKSIVSRMRHHFPESYASDDMYGVGVKALILAVNRFDPSKGKSFGNYAILRIKGSLLDELRKIDHLPRANRAKAKSLQSTILKLEAKLQRPPSDSEVAEALGLCNKDYQHLLKQTQPVLFVPIDSDAGNSSNDENSLSLHETIHDPTETTAFEKVEKKEKILHLRERIKELPDQHQKILMLYYMEELRLSEIAHTFNLSEGRISQIISHSILTLRAHFQTVI